MKKIGIYYGSSTGMTEGIAGKIAEKLGVSNNDIHNVADVNVETVNDYEALLLGSSTWGVGELQDDWGGFLEQLKSKNLSGKSVAVFGCGDCSAFGSSFCDAIGIIYNEIEGTGAKMCGKVSADGYSYDSSEAVVDGDFLGLALDENNESDLTDSRIADWTEQLKNEL